MAGDHLATGAGNQCARTEHYGMVEDKDEEEEGWDKEEEGCREDKRYRPLVKHRILLYGVFYMDLCGFLLEA